MRNRRWRGAALIAAFVLAASAALAEEVPRGTTLFSVASDDGDVIEAVLHDCELTNTTRYVVPYLGPDQLHLVVRTVDLRGVGRISYSEVQGDRVVTFRPRVKAFARFLETPAYGSEEALRYRDGKRSLQRSDSITSAVFPSGLLTEAETASLETAWRSCAPRLLRWLRRGLG